MRGRSRSSHTANEPFTARTRRRRESEIERLHRTDALLLRQRAPILLEPPVDQLCHAAIARGLEHAQEQQILLGRFGGRPVCGLGPGRLGQSTRAPVVEMEPHRAPPWGVTFAPRTRAGSPVSVWSSSSRAYPSASSAPSMTSSLSVPLRRSNAFSMRRNSALTRDSLSSRDW